MATMSRSLSCKVGPFSSHRLGLAQHTHTPHPSAVLTLASSVEMRGSAVFGGQAGYPRHAFMQEREASWRRTHRGRWLDTWLEPKGAI